MSEPITVRNIYSESVELETQWIQSADKVYRRYRWNDDVWSEWKLTPFKYLPFIQLKNIVQPNG